MKLENLIGKIYHSNKKAIAQQSFGAGTLCDILSELMRKYAFLILLLPFCVFSQNKFSLVNDSIEKQKLEEISIVKNERKYRGRNTLSFECDNKQNLKFADKDSDEYYVKFEELGVIKNSIIVIQKTEYNSEKYILLETKSCRQLILEGFPLRIENTEKYIVYNNPGTDEAYKIQILEYLNDFFEIKQTISFPKEILPKRILKVDNKEVFIMDVENRIWKTSAPIDNN